MELEVAHINGKAEKAAPTFSLLLCDKEAVRKFWPTLIRPGLVRIKADSERTNKSTGNRVLVKAKDQRAGMWQPEHVRQRIEAGFAGQIICDCYLIIQSNSPNPVGFTITQVYNDEFISTPLYLHNWITWCEKAPLWRVLPYALPFLEQRAKDLGLRGVQGVTSRLRWMKRLRKYGYQVHQIIIRKDFY